MTGASGPCCVRALSAGDHVHRPLSQPANDASSGSFRYEDVTELAFPSFVLNTIHVLFDTMLAAVVRNTFKPTISRAFAASTRQVRGIQTASLPPLPYAYNVRANPCRGGSDSY